MTQVDVLIVGGGIAGASLGAEIAASRSVLLIEAEPVCGFHSTGRSAAFWLESYGGGLRLTLPGRARLDVTYAHPLDPPLLTGANAKVPKDRILVSFTTQLLPWSRRR